MTARHLVIGLDGADLRIIESIGATKLPALFRLMKDGAFAALESVKPAATLPNWTTFLTGLDPGAHGVFDFTLRRGYGVSFAGGTARTAPLLVERLDALGLACACVSFPGTWPPPELEHGVFVSGWDSPVAFEADASHVWPHALHRDIVSRFGRLAFDDVDEFGSDATGWHETLGEKLVGRVGRKCALGSWLLEKKRWDVFALYFGESDTAAHHLWPLHDPASPRRPASLRATASPIETVYRALDAAVAELVERAGEGTEVTIVSDHGSGGSSDRVLYLNRALEESGLLAFRRRAGVSSRVVSAAKTAALRSLPPAIKERVFRAWGARLPSWLESQARFGAIDMRRTRAFSDELNYFPSVSLNLAGREPEGMVAAADRERTLREVEHALLAIRNPWTGEPAVARVFRREELYRGPHVERAPDLVLELALDRGYSTNLMPSATAARDGLSRGAWRTLEPSEYLGRKGRSLPGAHRSHGVYVASGPTVRAVGQVPAGIADASVTMLARMGIAPPHETRGRVLWDVLSLDAGARELPDARARTRQLGDASEVERRLRSLGYID